MQGAVFAPGEGLAVPVVEGIVRIGRYLFRSPSPEEVRLRCPVLGETAALLQDEAVEGAEGEDLGVPVMYGDTVGLGEFAGWEALHAGSGGAVPVSPLSRSRRGGWDTR